MGDQLEDVIERDGTAFVGILDTTINRRKGLGVDLNWVRNRNL